MAGDLFVENPGDEQTKLSLSVRGRGMLRSRDWVELAVVNSDSKRAATPTLTSHEEPGSAYYSVYIVCI